MTSEVLNAITLSLVRLRKMSDNLQEQIILLHQMLDMVEERLRKLENKQ